MLTYSYDRRASRVRLVQLPYETDNHGRIRYNGTPSLHELLSAGVQFPLAGSGQPDFRLADEASSPSQAEAKGRQLAQAYQRSDPGNMAEVVAIVEWVPDAGFEPSAGFNKYVAVVNTYQSDA